VSNGLSTDDSRQPKNGRAKVAGLGPLPAERTNYDRGNDSAGWGPSVVRILQFASGGAYVNVCHGDI